MIIRKTLLGPSGMLLRARMHFQGRGPLSVRATSGSSTAVHTSPAPEGTPDIEAVEEKLRKPRRQKKVKVDPWAQPPDASTFPPYGLPEGFQFEVLYKSKKSDARVGIIHTPHGPIETPGFVPVATNAALKFVDHTLADQEGLQLMFMNTLHLSLHPGSELVEAAGGLHRYMNRNKPIITDSGGFQVFSMAYQSHVFDLELGMKRRAPRKSTVNTSSTRGNGTDRPGSDEESEPSSSQAAAEAGPGSAVDRAPKARTQQDSQSSNLGLVERIDEQGVVFRSYRDGSPVLLTPEVSAAHQIRLGADIVLPLDELQPHNATPEQVQLNTLRSHRWMARSLRHFLEHYQKPEAGPRRQAMFGIVHGGTSLDLRKQSAEYLASLPFDGFCIGGALGKDPDDMQRVLSYITTLLPDDKPRHVLGIADHKHLERLSSYGGDTFDSCYPTRIGRHGNLMTAGGVIKVSRGYNSRLFRAPDPDCGCYTCKNHSMAYLYHLFKANEPLGPALATLHNLAYMTRMMKGVREKILRGDL